MLSAALLLLFPQEVPADALLQNSAPACVQIRSYGKTMAAGSGFVFGARNLVVTSARVVAGASRNVVIDRAGNAHRAIGLVKDTPNDIAVILLADDLACTPLEATGEATPGTPAFLIGYPLDRPEITLAGGTVSAVKGPTGFALSLPVGPGAGGAAILNAKGELLGMASRTEAGSGVAIPAPLIAAAARRATESVKPEGAPPKDENAVYSEARDSGEIVDDPNDENGEFAPARIAIENARRRDGDRSLPPVAPAERDPDAAKPPRERAPEEKAPVEASTKKVSDPRMATSAAFARF